MTLPDETTRLIVQYARVLAAYRTAQARQSAGDTLAGYVARLDALNTAIQDSYQGGPMGCKAVNVNNDFGNDGARRVTALSRPSMK